MHKLSLKHGIPPLIVLVEGHTNCKDPAMQSSPYHMRLSVKRALACREYLESAGESDFEPNSDREVKILLTTIPDPSPPHCDLKTIDEDHAWCAITWLAVLSHLTQIGVDPRHLRSKGFGGTKPISERSQANQRTELCVQLVDRSMYLEILARALVRSLLVGAECRECYCHNQTNELIL